ncbi:MAG TPA: hypothetical protein V6D21_14475 [Candidatus Obscuribacterales bacterium]
MGFIVGNSFSSNLNSSVSYPFIKEWEGNIVEKVIVVPESKDLREISIYSDGAINLYWGNQTIPFWTINNQVFVDSSTATSLSIEPLDGDVNVKILVRSVKQINYEIGGGSKIVIPVKIRLAIGTGENYFDVNADSYDDVYNSYQYLVNLQKLKDSDSGVTGFKLFDIFSFFPSQPIEFDVVVDSPEVGEYLPETIAVQIFDPLIVGEVMFAIANDVINLELNGLGNKFVGNLTRGAFYHEIANGKINVLPDYSRHVGRFVARNIYTDQYDTAIIKSYTPNSNQLLGGTFTLTGSF